MQRSKPMRETAQQPGKASNSKAETKNFKKVLPAEKQDQRKRKMPNRPDPTEAIQVSGLSERAVEPNEMVKIRRIVRLRPNPAPATPNTSKLPSAKGATSGMKMVVESTRDSKAPPVPATRGGTTYFRSRVVKSPPPRRMPPVGVACRMELPRAVPRTRILVTPERSTPSELPSRQQLRTLKRKTKKVPARKPLRNPPIPSTGMRVVYRRVTVLEKLTGALSGGIDESSSSDEYERNSEIEDICDDDDETGGGDDAGCSGGGGLAGFAF